MISSPASTYVTWPRSALTQTTASGYAIDGKLELSDIPAQVFESWCALQTEDSCPPVSWRGTT